MSANKFTVSIPNHASNKAMQTWWEHLNQPQRANSPKLQYLWLNNVNGTFSAKCMQWNCCEGRRQVGELGSDYISHAGVTDVLKRFSTWKKKKQPNDVYCTWMIIQLCIQRPKIYPLYVLDTHRTKKTTQYLLHLVWLLAHYVKLHNEHWSLWDT